MEDQQAVSPTDNLARAGALSVETKPENFHAQIAARYNQWLQAGGIVDGIVQVYLPANFSGVWSDPVDYYTHSLSAHGILPQDRRFTPEEVSKALAQIKSILLENEDKLALTRAAYADFNQQCAAYGFKPQEFDPYTFHLVSKDRIAQLCQVPVHLAVTFTRNGYSYVMFPYDREDLNQHPDWQDLWQNAVIHERGHLERDANGLFTDSLPEASLPLEEGIVQAASRTIAVDNRKAYINCFEFETWVAESLAKQLQVESLMRYSHQQIKDMMARRYPQAEFPRHPYHELDYEIGSYNLAVKNAREADRNLQEQIKAEKRAFQPWEQAQIASNYEKADRIRHGLSQMFGFTAPAPQTVSEERQEITQQDLVNYGNPAKTRPLSDEELATPLLSTAETSTPPATENLSRIAKWLNENFFSPLSASEQERARTIYTFTANVFLRHLPLTQRAVAVRYITEITKLDPEVKNEGFAARVGVSIFGETLGVDPENITSDPLIHEAIHLLQRQGYLPYNYALTYAATEVIRLMQHKEKFVSRQAADHPALKDPDMTAQDYFHKVLTGETYDVLVGEWRLQRSDLNHEPDFRIYLEREKEFDKELATWSERAEKRFGVKSPYNALLNVGSARGLRAYAVGHFSGNMDNAWTILWLHGRGMPFEQAERLVVQKIQDGTAHQLYDYPELNPADIVRVLAAEELFGERKIPRRLLDEFESANRLSIRRDIRQLLEKLFSAKTLAVEFTRALKHHYETIPPEELQERYAIFSRWLNEHTLRDTRDGRIVLDLSDIASSVTALTWNSVLRDRGQAANLLFFRHNGGSRATLAGVREGAKLSGTRAVMPKEPSTILPEQAGVFHTHPLYNAPPSIPDLLQLADDPRRFISIVSSQDAVYAVVKPLEVARARRQMSLAEKTAQRSHLLLEALTHINSGDSLDDLYRTKAAELGLEIYQINRIIDAPPVTRAAQPRPSPLLLTAA